MVRSHPECAIEVYEQDYVLPGLIDLGVRCNGSWGSAETESKAAVAGGVTFFLEEPSVYHFTAPSAQLYCDVGACALLNSADPMADLRTKDYSDVFALKAYLTPVSAQTLGLKESLDRLVRFPLEIPLILDCFLPSEASLRLNSPFRLSSLHDRENEMLSSRLSNGDGFSSDVTPCMPDEDKSIFLPPVQQKRGRNPCEDVVDELQRYRKIHGRRETYEALSKVSLLGYNHSGTTSFQQDSASMSPKTSTVLTPRMRRRPSAISVQPFRSAEVEEYLGYYSQYPEETETMGVDALLAALRTLESPTKCRIHVANVCSASAICSVLAFKSHFRGHLSVETAPHYLFYTYDKVEPGNTRFKVCPPLRCAENQKFLWKLLRAEGLDSIASCHSSLSLDYKFLNNGSFKRALSGISSLGFGLKALVTRSCTESSDRSSREKDLAKFAVMMATRPASILGIDGKRGAIEKCRFADLVVIAAFEEPGESPAYGKYPEACPFASEMLYGRVKKVIIRGKTAFENGEFFAVGRHETRKAYI